MTTTVTILINGNKACSVNVVESTEFGGDPTATEVIVQPGSFATQCIHGNQVLEVKEVGEFVN